MLFACAMASVFFLTLFALVQTDHLNYPLIIAYAIVVGTLGAFMTPARDALLSQVAPDTSTGGIQKAVAFASLTQFGAQIVGMLFAAIAPLVGVGNLLLGQAACRAGGDDFGLGWFAPCSMPRAYERVFIFSSLL
jgi:MFS family permease